jgi:hypothetical protein
VTDPAVIRTIAAWVVPGPRPDIHAEAQDRLRREWPALAGALDALTAATLTTTTHTMEDHS